GGLLLRGRRSARRPHARPGGRARHGRRRVRVAERLPAVAAGRGQHAHRADPAGRRGGARAAAGRARGRQPAAGRQRPPARRRAGERGEVLAYGQSRYGGAIPKPVKRGVGDAALALYREYPLLKYDTGTHGIRFADVLALTHPGDRKGSAQGGRFAGAWQHDLFAHAIDRRYGRDETPPEPLAMIAANKRLRRRAGEGPSVLVDAARL